MPDPSPPNPLFPSFLSLCKRQLSGWGTGLISPTHLLHARQHGARSVRHPSCQQTGLHRLLHPDSPLVLPQPGLDVLRGRERAPEPVGRFGETLADSPPRSLPGTLRGAERGKVETRGLLSPPPTTQPANGSRLKGDVVRGGVCGQRNMRPARFYLFLDQRNVYKDCHLGDILYGLGTMLDILFLCSHLIFTAIPSGRGC